MHKGWLYVFLLIFIVTSCDSVKEQDKKIEYVEASIQKQIGDSCSNSGAQCFELQLTYPTLNFSEDSAGIALQDTINALLLTPIFEEKKYLSQEELFNDIQEAYIEFKEDFPEVETKWFLDRQVKVLGQREGIVTLSFFESSYMGGAHSNEMTFYKNYLISTGRRVTLEEFYTSAERAQLTKIAETEFRKQKNLGAEDSLEEAGFWFDNGTFSLNDNFYLTEEGVTFFYNSYEIAAYSHGSTTIFISSSALQNI